MFLLLLLESFSPVPVVLLHLRTINSHSPKLERCMSKIYLVLECFKIFLRAFCILSAEWKCVQNFAQLSDKSGSKLTFSGSALSIKNPVISRHFLHHFFLFCNWILHIWNGFYIWSQSKISLLSPLIIGSKLTFISSAGRWLPTICHVQSHLNYYIYII